MSLESIHPESPPVVWPCVCGTVVRDGTLGWDVVILVVAPRPLVRFWGKIKTRSIVTLPNGLYSLSPFFHTHTHTPHTCTALHAQLTFSGSRPSSIWSGLLLSLLPERGSWEGALIRGLFSSMFPFTSNRGDLCWEKRPLRQYPGAQMSQELPILAPSLNCQHHHHQALSTTCAKS